MSSEPMIGILRSAKDKSSYMVRGTSRNEIKSKKNQNSKELLAFILNISTELELNNTELNWNA